MTGQRWGGLGVAEYRRRWALALLGCAAVLATLGSERPSVEPWRIDRVAARPEPDTGLPGETVSRPRQPAKGLAAGSLHTAGASLLDADGREVRLTGVNWFGLETNTFAPHGLWARNWEELLDQIAALGWNALRLPFSNQLFDPESRPNGIDYQRNPDLAGLTGLQIMDRIIAGAGARGVRVILDRHRPGADAQSALWYTDRYPEERWIADWQMLARRYRGNAAVIGADLHNEPHGTASWGSGELHSDWRLAAERAGNAILAINPDWLIVVEGVETYRGDSYWWGGNLKGAQEFPVRLNVASRLVYSAHDYGPGVYNQRWFLDPSFPANLPGLWDAHWGYVARGDYAPVLMGEFGGRSVGNDREGLWQRQLLNYLHDNALSYVYWALNPNSGDTGGLLDDDWAAVNLEKQMLLQRYQWPRFAAVPARLPAGEVVRLGESAGGWSAVPAGQDAKSDGARALQPLPHEASGMTGEGRAAGAGDGITRSAGNTLKVRLRSGRREIRSNNPAPELELVNDGVWPVPLMGLELRYWFREITTVGVRQIADLDWASPGRDKLRVEILPTGRGGQDYYVAVTFPNAGEATLPVGGSVEVKLRFHKEDWSEHDQSQHYSFAPLDTYIDWDKVTLYQEGKLIWGKEPGS